MSDSERGDERNQTVRFHYVKSAHFRTIHVDGVIGGPTPSGFVQMTLYNERVALPQISEHSVSPDGTLSVPISTSGKDGLVREMDVGIMMSRDAAQEIRDWLTACLGDIDTAEDVGEGA